MYRLYAKNGKAGQPYNGHPPARYQANTAGNEEVYYTIEGYEKFRDILHNDATINDATPY